MSRLDRFQQHDEDVAFPCPCGGTVVAKFVLPTTDGRFAIIGKCPKCMAEGHDPTTIAYLRPEGPGEVSRFKRFQETSRFVYKKEAA